MHKSSRTYRHRKNKGIIHTLNKHFRLAIRIGRVRARCILLQIREAQAIGLPYVYLGYWIDGCRKMSYKARYVPLELFVDGQWQQRKTEQQNGPSTDAIIDLLGPSKTRHGFDDA